MVKFDKIEMYIELCDDTISNLAKAKMNISFLEILEPKKIDKKKMKKEIGIIEKQMEFFIDAKQRVKETQRLYEYLKKPKN